MKKARGRKVYMTSITGAMGDVTLFFIGNLPAILAKVSKLQDLHLGIKVSKLQDLHLGIKVSKLQDF